MAKQLSYKPLRNIGVNGLNTQANPTTLDASWLTSANNIVLRESGRISFRKGLKQNVLATSAKIGSIGEDGSNVIVAAVGTNMYTLDFTAPDAPWTSSFATGGTASDWQMIPFKGELYCVQEGHIPVEYDSGTWSTLTTATGYVAPAGVTTFNPRCGMGYYGRLWVGGITEEKDVVYYSDTLDAHKWSGSSAGSIDLKTVWGTDEIIAIEPFYGKLVIFGRHNIVIYNNPIDPLNMALDEVVRGVGCASRDSIQAVGDDLLFLSHTGLRSLSRTTQVDKVPLQDYSLNIKDTLVRNTSQSNIIKSCYVANEGVYILTYVDLNITYVFDMKHWTPNKAPRVTTWSFDSNANPSSMLYTEARGLLVGQGSGSVATYEGYFDKTYVSGGSYTSVSYTGTFKTIWIDLGDSVVASLLKKMKAIISGGAGTFVGVKWYKDFDINPSKAISFTLNPAASGISALYGASTSLFGASKFAPHYGLKEYNIPLTGSAKHLQIEMTAETNGYVASLQDMTLLYKQGKIR